MAFEFVACGDIHADKLGHLFSDHHDLQFRAMCKTADYAIKHGIKHWIQTGDVSDKPRLSEEARVMLFEFMHRYDGKLEMDWVLGNHDLEYEGFHSMQFFAQLVKKKKLKTTRIHCVPEQRVIGGVPVNMMPFPHNKALPHKGGGTFNIGHFERPGCIRDNGTKMDDEHGVKEGKGDDHWLLGHLHTHQHKGRSWWTGTLYQTNFGESLPKGFTHGRVARLSSGKLKVDLKFIEVQPEFVLHNLKIEKPSDLKQIVDDPYQLYKVVVKRGVELPYDVATRHSNVVNNPTTYKTDKQAETLLNDAEVEIKFGLTDDLGAELKKRGHDKATRKRGIQIVEEIVRSL